MREGCIRGRLIPRHAGYRVIVRTIGVAPRFPGRRPLPACSVRELGQCGIQRNRFAAVPDRNGPVRRVRVPTCIDECLELLVRDLELVDQELGHLSGSIFLDADDLHIGRRLWDANHVLRQAPERVHLEVFPDGQDP